MRYFFEKYTPSFMFSMTALLSVIIWYVVRQNMQISETAKFAKVAEQIRNSVGTATQSYINGLLQTRGLFEANEKVTKTQFQRFLESFNFQKSFPGALAIGYTERFTHEERKSFLARIKSKNPDFKFWPQDKREEYFATLYLEPEGPRNRVAIGYDMFTEPTRRYAMELARDTGLPAVTGGVQLVQSGEKNSDLGFLIYVPVYKQGTFRSTVETRRKNLQGFVYSPFRATDLFNLVLRDYVDSNEPSQLDIEVFDGNSFDESKLLYNSDGKSFDPNPQELRQIIQAEIAGRTWSIVLTSLPSFGSAYERYLSWIVLGIGLFISILVYYVTRLTRSRAEAERKIAVKEKVAKENQRFLVEASSKLSGSLDFSETLNQLVKIPVPHLSDWAAVDLVEEGYLKRAAVYCLPGLEPELQRACDALRDRRISISGGSPVSTLRVLKWGKPLLFRDTDDESRSVLAMSDSENLLVSKTKLTISAPLLSQGETVGVFTIGLLGEEGRRLDILMDLFPEFARRASLSVESARLYRNAQAANRAKDEFLATLSHELRTPLNAIVGWAELLAEEDIEPQIFQRGVDALKRNAKAQEELINDLLDVSRIISGKLSIDVSMVDISTIARSALDAVRFSAEAHNVTLRSNIDGENFYVEGDARRLQQIVWNLLSNAVKFTPPGGTVDLIVDGSTEFVRVSVKDTGQGIEKEFLPFVFDRFRQQDSSITRKFGGLGLGLSIVRHLVELHGGVAEVRSEGTGRGASFDVKLPRSDNKKLMEHFSQQKAPHLDVKNQNLASSLKGRNLLVIDDANDVLVLLSTALKRAGAIVETVSSGRLALEKLRSGTVFDAMISDLGMPEMDGFELIQNVRRLDDDLKDIPAIALSAYVRQEERDRALELGYNLHVGKPINPFELIKKVQALVQ